MSRPMRLRSLSDGDGSSLLYNRIEFKRPKFQYSGWVFHLGTNKIGHEFCHPRFLFIRGKYVEMYKRDPDENPGIRPIRRGVVGHTLMVEELGCRKVNCGDVYVLRFYNRLDESKKGEIACATAGEAQKWLEAFDQAKQQAEYELSNGGRAREKLNLEAEIDLDAHRHRVRKYAHGFIKLIKIRQESLLRQSSSLADNAQTDGYMGINGDGDVVEAHTWKCVCTMNGIRIFEDVVESKGNRGILVKSVGIIDADVDTVFEVLMSLEPSQRYEWDMLTSDLELVESIDKHFDVVYGTYDPKYFTWWSSKRDFVFSRKWFHGQNGTSILQIPAVHKKCPTRSGYQRTKINPSTWEIKSLDTEDAATELSRCLVTHMLEIQSESWGSWKKSRSSKFEKSIPYALLCQVAGLKEYIGANPVLKNNSVTTVLTSQSSEDAVAEEFYDAICAESSEDDDSDDNIDVDNKDNLSRENDLSGSPILETISAAQNASSVLDSSTSPIPIDPSQFCGSLHDGKDDDDINCWTNPGGSGFMIRGSTYLKDYAKVRAGDPLLKLLAVDWLKADQSIDKVALRPSCVVQSEAGKKLPFILIFNLQIPAKPNYNLVLYYAADRPVNKSSLLGQFIDGTDTFRDSKFKLIPSIVKGYWMVKRAVGTKACLLGKSVTCRYLRQDNFLEIDVDIGSSSVARSVIGLVLGYVTSLVVDLAVLIEANEETELPEHLLGVVRLSCLRLDSAVEA
ncbi:protein ENHANCED DISEASE RESISTANCE 2 [Amaranthus tricolor]|uniref:protein ENHANCED DISEASE RESISTANCE 2 n=1 Tax=Amaranthus tricolor TaxID=29722 RepID=UPI00258A8ACA|nr:protein ENHANCED DISEASE RESISTANCE 2 [Amaranthus tricolor]